ncbi:hypothetical protein V2I01_02055 [Micromonospora sp. BRA006-A]|nr:hypothetical protein [Micromonospora sp. BRA006-A]
MVAGMAGVATRKDREAADYRSRAAATTADPDLRRVYDSGAEVAAREAEAYRTGCACVYAAVECRAGRPARAHRASGRPGGGPGAGGAPPGPDRVQPRRCPNSGTWSGRRPTPDRPRQAEWAIRRKPHGR